MTVVGGNVTFNCSFQSDSPWPKWEHKQPNQSEFKVVHNGVPGISAHYPAYFYVEIVENTAEKFSYLTLRNATPEFAGKYRCAGGSSPQSSGEEELVVLSKYFVHLNAPQFTCVIMLETFNANEVVKSNS